jgi:hypothetical protein
MWGEKQSPGAGLTAENPDPQGRERKIHAVWKKAGIVYRLFSGSSSRTRTYDPAVNSRMLYQLSY